MCEPFDYKTHVSVEAQRALALDERLESPLDVAGVGWKTQRGQDLRQQLFLSHPLLRLPK